MQENLQKQMKKMHSSIKPKHKQAKLVKQKESKARDRFGPAGIMARLERLRASKSSAVNKKESRLLQSEFVTGMPGCACLGFNAMSGNPMIEKKDNCTYDWSYQGKCVVTSGGKLQNIIYPGDYGEICKAHEEPGAASCYNQSQYPPVELSSSLKAPWCDEPWCYVDPCNCDAGDATKSDYFPELLYYSYATCGSKNMYTAMESGSNMVGNAQCAQAVVNGSSGGSLGGESGMGSSACSEKCPGVAAMMEAFKSLEGEPEQTFICQFQEAVSCAAASQECWMGGKPPFRDELAAEVKCMCSCPAFTSGSDPCAAGASEGLVDCLVTEPYCAEAKAVEMKKALEESGGTAVGDDAMFRAHMENKLKESCYKPPPPRGGFGHPGCPCVGDIAMYDIEKFDCDYEWAFGGKCVQPSLTTNFTHYPGDYGESCAPHKEPGATDCFDLSVSPPVELPTEKQANWCNSPWCYVDPCYCDASDATPSDYFPYLREKLTYSYETCDGANTYTESTPNANVMGSAECMWEVDDGGEGEMGPPELPKECLAACPGLEAMMALQNDASKSGKYEEDAEAGLAAMCPYIETMKCQGASKECNPYLKEMSAEDMEMMAGEMEKMYGMLECMCECPGVAKEEGPCEDVQGGIGCVMQAEQCQGMVAEMTKEMDDPTQFVAFVELQCKWKDAGCEEKSMSMQEKPKCARAGEAWMFNKCDMMLDDPAALNKVPERARLLSMKRANRRSNRHPFEQLQASMKSVRSIVERARLQTSAPSVRRLDSHDTAPAPATTTTAFTTPVPAPVTGMESCSCIGGVLHVPRTPCDEFFRTPGKGVAVTEECVKADNGQLYASDYGAECDLHKEPGSAACFDLTTGIEKNASLQEHWCTQKWCYIDPCNCDAADATPSDYFPGKLSYSYATCGAVNTYTETMMNSSMFNPMGSSKCIDAQIPEGGGSGMPAMMSEACQAACPKVMDFLQSSRGGRRLQEQSPAQQAMAMCSHLDTIQCISTTPDCLDENVKAEDLKKSSDGLGCMCACPTALDKEKMCADPESMDAALDCMIASNECAELKTKAMEKQNVTTDAAFKEWAKSDMKDGKMCEQFKPPPPPRGHMGLPTCSCLGQLPEWIEKYKCDYDFAFHGKCVKAFAEESLAWTEYPADYGETCAIHKEPGQAGCYNVEAMPPVELPAEKQADWCGSEWCYVDPCNCDAADVTQSDYFPGMLQYSYATCGAKNTYTATESKFNTVGNAECWHKEDWKPEPEGPPLSCCMAASELVECQGVQCSNLAAAVSLMDPNTKKMEKELKEMEGISDEERAMYFTPAHERSIKAGPACALPDELIKSEAELRQFVAGGGDFTAPAPTPTPAPAPGAAPTPAPKVVIVEEVFVESKIEIVQEFSPETTADTLMADEGFKASVQESTAASLGVPPSDVEITGFDLKDASRRLTGAGRRLAGVKKALTVDYKVKVEDATKAEEIKAVLEDPVKREAAQAAFQEKYEEKETARTGAAPKGLEVKAEEKVEVKTEKKEVIVPYDPADDAKADETVDLASSQIVGLAFLLAAGQVVMF
jgi:hypothetical protein